MRQGRGHSCASISNATKRTYKLTSADLGNTVRFKVEASNSDGSTSASSVPTAVIRKPETAPAPAPAAPPTGCPSGSGPAAVGAISPPARLVIDDIQSDPQVVSRGTSMVILRVHVSNTCTQAVRDALVYATAVPFNQLTVPAEQPTGSSGWAELRFQTLAGFPATARQQLIALSVRARRPGGELLAGISTRRLVSVRADVRQ